MHLPGPVALSDASAALLSLLITAHFLADLVFQTERVAAAKETRLGALLEHGLVTFGTHVVLLIPFLSIRILPWFLLLAALHIVQDGVRSRVFGERGRSLGAFLLDQLLHLSLAVALWAVLVSRGVSGPLPGSAVSQWLPLVSRAALVVSGLVFTVRGGGTIVERVLRRFPAASPDGDLEVRYRMGRVIGYLERVLVYVLVLNGQWGALGLVVAAKSIARFPELDSKAFSDYYLIGTLSSMVCAIAAGMVVRVLIT